MKVVQKRVRITSIRRTAPRPNGLPGNLIANQGASQFWISSQEWRNNLIGMGLPPHLPPTAFVGCFVNFEELTIEPADVEGGKTVKHVANGREIEFKKAGVNNVGLSIDISTTSFGTDVVALAKLGEMANEARIASQGAAVVRQTAPAMQTETLVNEPEDTDTTQPPVTTPAEVLHEDLATAGTNS